MVLIAVRVKDEKIIAPFHNEFQIFKISVVIKITAFLAYAKIIMTLLMVH